MKKLLLFFSLFLLSYFSYARLKVHSTGVTCIGFTSDYPEVFSLGIFITYLATGNIQNNANFLIQNGATINLKSQESVSLLPGFDVELGGTLEITTK